ncbi:DUF1543 domain-containing protein [Chitinophaga arvensicola]|uniref:DUF1543 domain-containing protein n=1 Tax=Chitinophaga arvensicola TaxID=29529 RepID=A0A1I0SC19_9BACT|nr:DUF1543 domain-containing protein [Chitinophaga arvensicola]SEW54292.1 protein of unknown function [Chitinophaga arvensicola]
MAQLKLFMLLLGCKPEGRHTEQHDVFFGIGEQLRDLIPDMKAFWPEAKDKLHIDGYREVNIVDGYQVKVVEKKESTGQDVQLFFLNLGGYKPDEMEEFHYKILSVQKDIGVAIRESKQTTFFKHTTFGNATSHVDDKYGVDVDDVHAVKDILPAYLKERYTLEITPVTDAGADVLHLGYFQLSKI